MKPTAAPQGIAEVSAEDNPPAAAVGLSANPGSIYTTSQPETNTELANNSTGHQCHLCCYVSSTIVMIVMDDNEESLASF